MRSILLFMAVLLLSGNVYADSFRCGRKIVKTGDTGNVLVKKCGQPVRKFSSKETVYDGGQQSNVTVSNWVFQRLGKNDMIVSILRGTVVKIRVE
jgi:hypothetical protein